MYAAVCRALTDSGATALFSLMDFREIWGQVLRVFLLSGSIIGALGSSFAIRKFLQV